MSGKVIDPSKVRTGNKRKWFKLFSSFCFGNRFIKTLYADQKRAVPLVGRRIRRFQANRLLKLTLSFGAIPIPAKLNEGHRSMGLCKLLVNLQRFGCGFFRFWKSLFRFLNAVNNLHVVAIG